MRTKRTPQYAAARVICMFAGLALANQIAFAVDVPPTTLSIERWADHTVRLSCDGLRYEVYSIEGRPDFATPWAVIGSQCAGMDGSMAFIDHGATNLPMRFYRSTGRPANPGSLLCALLVKQNISLSGNMIIDSFNSQDPYSSTDGQYDPAKSNDSGDIATICTNTPKVFVGGGGAQVYGHVGTGPNDTVSPGTSSCGSKGWVNGGNSGIQPGWWITNMIATIPDVSLPSLAWQTPVAGNYSYGGTNYSFWLNGGNYGTSSGFALSGGQNVLVTGNVVLYVPGTFNISGFAYIYLAPGSSLTCYFGGKVIVSGHGVVNGTGFATNCTFYGLPSNTSFNYSGGSGLIGTIYTPEADVTLSGNTSEMEFVGAVAANSANISGSYRFHYDESLRLR